MWVWIEELLYKTQDAQRYLGPYLCCFFVLVISLTLLILVASVTILNYLQ